jgi:hypothetical protein
MIKNSLLAIGTTARELVRDWRSLGLFNALYAALIAALWLFFSTKEASAWQLVLTALLAVAAPVLFFLLQSAGAVRYAWNEAPPATLFRKSVKALWKIILVSVPLILLAVLLAYLLNKLQARFPVTDAARPALIPVSHPSAAHPPVLPLRWPDVFIASLRLLLLGVVLPLAAIHLWLAAARDSFIGTVRRVPQILARAFSAQSVLIYAVGLILFLLMPYFLIFTRTTIRNAWAELLLFGLRLALAFVFTLWGWLVTVGALARTDVNESLSMEERNIETPPRIIEA